MFQRRWSEQEIIRHVQSRQTGEPLNYQHYVTHYPDVHAAAIRLFGSWENTIEACGIDYASVRKYHRWTRAKVVGAICNLADSGEPLNSGYIQDHHRSLYLAALRRFGSWGAAVEAAGRSYAEVSHRHTWTPAELRAAIQHLAAAGEDLAYPGMREHHPALLGAASRHLGDGSWAIARRRAGITTDYRRRALARRRHATLTVPVIIEDGQKADLAVI